jgi:hypothetical protein
MTIVSTPADSHDAGIFPEVLFCSAKILFGQKKG